MAFAVAAAIAQGADRHTARVDLEAVTAQVVEGTNRFREAEGLPALHVDARLAQAAAEFAQFMARTAKYAHEADGREPAERAEAHAYRYCIVLENITYHYDSRGFETRRLAEAEVDGWKRSPGHRKNMLNALVTHTGVAVARAPNGYYYAVQMFGLPRSASVKFEVRNESREAVRYRVGDQAYAAPANTIRTHEVCMREAVRFQGLSRTSEPFQPVPGESFVIPPSGAKVLRERR